MSLDTTVLRANLQYCCDDLVNLVTSDLDECKWPIKRRIFISLLKRAPSLSEFFDEIIELEDSRSNQRKVNKTNSLTSESLMEQEKSYRTRFIQIIANALTHLRWPPALEPFSDILGLLFDDKLSVYNAYDYIIKIGINFIQERERKIDMPRFKENSSPNDYPDKMGFKINNFPHSIEITSQPVNYNNIQIINDINQNNEKSIRPNTSTSTNKSTPRSATATTNHSDIKQARSDAFNDLTTLTRAFHILQHHNEELLKRLNAIQEIINSREAAEQKLEHILDDLSKAIEEVVEISQHHRSTMNHSSRNSHTEVSSTGRDGAGEVFMSESSLSQDKLSASKFTTTNETAIPLPRRGRNSTPTPSTTTTTTTTALSGNQRLRSNSQGPARIHSVTNKDRDKALPQSPRSLPSDISSEPHVPHQPDASNSAYLSCKSTSSNKKISSQPSPQLTSSTTGIWSKLRGQIVALKEMWLSARRELGRLTFATISLYPPEKSNIESFVQNNTTKTGREMKGNVTVRVGSGEMLLRQLLAVRPQLSVSFKGNSLHDDSRGGMAESGLALDTGRIHQLQRSLIDFVAAISSLLCHTSVLNTTDDSESEVLGVHSIVWPLTSHWCTVLHALQSLKDRASDLVLQTALLAPVSTMCLTNPILSSHCSGLEALSNEVSNMINVVRNKKSIATLSLLLPKLEQALDRNRKEQISLALEYRKAQRTVDGWNLAASMVTKQLEGFGTSTSKELQIASDSLSELTNSVSVVVEAYLSAENCRLSAATDVSGTGSGKPLDSLARGYMGVEVATLIKALRLHSEELKDLPVRMTDIRRKFVSDVTTALNKLSGYGQDIESLRKNQQQQYRKGTPSTAPVTDETVVDSSLSSSRSKKRQPVVQKKS